jgi:hypothetical protein
MACVTRAQSSVTPQADPMTVVCSSGSIGSPFIPVDSWIYPAALRLFSLGYLDSAYLGLRPWTRDSLRRALREAVPNIPEANIGTKPVDEEAIEIFQSLLKEAQAGSDCGLDNKPVHLESAYTTIRGISGPDLRDSFHIGSSLINDYGRPYGDGVNSYSGVSGYASKGRFVIYARGEFQRSAMGQGYSATLAQSLDNLDTIIATNPATGLPYTLSTVPYGNVQSVAHMHLLEAYASANVANHMISFGKLDEWLGPAQGSSMAYSNNADDIYALHIDRVEPLRVPGLSRITGPFRYEFMVGPLQGHDYLPPDSTHWVLPGNPWMHVEKVSFKPMRRLEIGFERTVIWGGQGHEAINLHTFLRSFFSTVNVPAAVKNSDQDPGARFAAFDVTYRLPGQWLTFYVDSEVHDSVSPPSNPAIMAYRPGLYLTRLPGTRHLDVRFEAVNTDPSTWRSLQGSYMYWEYLQKQGYTNKGVLLGDWIGREGKGGQAWITDHLSPNEWIQVGYRRQKAATDFIAGGTTFDEVSAQLVKRIRHEWELNAYFAFQMYKAPIYLPGAQKVSITNFSLTRFFK